MPWSLLETVSQSVIAGTAAGAALIFLCSRPNLDWRQRLGTLLVVMALCVPAGILAWFSTILLVGLPFMLLMPYEWNHAMPIEAALLAADAARVLVVAVVLLVASCAATATANDIAGRPASLCGVGIIAVGGGILHMALLLAADHVWWQSGSEHVSLLYTLTVAMLLLQAALAGIWFMRSLRQERGCRPGESSPGDSVPGDSVPGDSVPVDSAR